MTPTAVTDAPTLPCPLSAGWEIVSRAVLPRRAADGRRLGGFSALALEAGAGRRLWLLSDARRGYLLPVRGWEEPAGARLRIGTPRPLLDRRGAPIPGGLDGEGLVLSGGGAWVASEGRGRSRPPRVLRFDLSDGRLREERPLPGDWRPRAAGTGLAPNRGPESLALWGGDLLLAAETPLRQDAGDRVRLLLLPAAAAPRPLRPLAFRPRSLNWGLTELLPLPGSGHLLALVRGYDPLQGWWARLELHHPPRPAGAAAPPLMPIADWDLLALGLPEDNWEGMTLAPATPDGRPTLLLVSDDNFSPAQRSWLVRLAPRRAPGCRPSAPLPEASR
jgi:hypothetical protein